MVRRSTWRPAAAPTPRQVLPALILTALALGVIGYLIPYIFWGAL